MPLAADKIPFPWRYVHFLAIGVSGDFTRQDLHPTECAQRRWTPKGCPLMSGAMLVGSWHGGNGRRLSQGSARDGCQ